MYLTEPNLLHFSFHENNSTINQTEQNKNSLDTIWSTCYIFGILTHYFYLSFFLWSNVLAYDLYQTLGSLLKSGNRIKEDRNKILIFYSIYAWSMPLIIVIALILKQFLSKSTYLSYGFGVCFISQSMDRLIFFIIPVNLILIFKLKSNII